MSKKKIELSENLTRIIELQDEVHKTLLEIAELTDSLNERERPMSGAFIMTMVSPLNEQSSYSLMTGNDAMLYGMVEIVKKAIERDNMLMSVRMPEVFGTDSPGN